MLFLRDLERADVLLKLAFIDSMLIFGVLELDLGLLLELSELVQVLEDQMLDALLVDLDLNLILLSQILQLALLVAQLGAPVFGLFLRHYPEVVDPLALVLVEPRQVFFLSDEGLQLATFLAQSLLVVLIIDIVHGVGSGASLFLETASFLRRVFLTFLGRHFKSF